MKRRHFVKSTGALAATSLFTQKAWAMNGADRLRTAHVGVGGMGGEDLKAISSHAQVDVVALCDVDANNLAAAHKLHPNAKIYADYRVMLKEMKDGIDAVIVSTPDHTHAPASMSAMKLGKAVYCQKPLTHHVSEARAMDALAKEKNLTTQMGIQVHSFYDYKLATHLIQSGIIGKVSTVRAWSPKNYGLEGQPPADSDPIPEHLDWNLWLGTAKERPYKEGLYHPGRWRRIMDYGCGTLGDMGVHIFDTPYNALQLDVPRTIINNCEKSNGFGFPSINEVTYEFPGTKYTADTLKWVWHDGPGAPNMHKDFDMPGNLPDQGAMFVGEKGRLLLPHFSQEPKLIIDGTYVNIDVQVAEMEAKHNLGSPIRNYGLEAPKHYLQFVDACLGKDTCSAPFSYSARLTEVILLGVIAGRFPNQTLHWNNEMAKFDEEEANEFLGGSDRDF